jgi:hypothetical protein
LSQELWIQEWLSFRAQFQELDWSAPSLESGSLGRSQELGLCLELSRASSFPEMELRFPASELPSRASVPRFQGPDL